MKLYIQHDNSDNIELVDDDVVTYAYWSRRDIESILSQYIDENGNCSPEKRQEILGAVLDDVENFDGNFPTAESIKERVDNYLSW